MMALLLGQIADSIHESQSGLKVSKLVSAHEVMLVDDIPLRRFRQLLMNFREFVSLQRRNTAAAGDASSVCKREVTHRALDARQLRAMHRNAKAMIAFNRRRRSRAGLGLGR